MSAPEDIKYGYKDTQFIIQPIMTKDEVIQFVIQCESKISRSKKHIGFSAADEQIIKVISFYLQMRIERRNALQEVKRREQ